MIHRGKPGKLEISRNLLSDLHNLQLINKLFGFAQSLRKANEDLDNLFETYADLRTLIINSKNGHELYSRDTEAVISFASKIEAFLKSIEADLIEIASAVRIRIRKDVPWSLIVGRFFNRGLNSELSAVEVNKEAEVLNKEMDDIEHKYSEKIDKVLGVYSSNKLPK